MSELKFLSFSLILYLREIQILSVQVDSIYKGLAFPLHRQGYTFYQSLLPKCLSTHHSAESKRLSLQTFRMYLQDVPSGLKRLNVSFKTVSGESNACTDEMVAPWEQTTLPTILFKHDLNQIYSLANLACFIALNQISPYIWRMKSQLVVNAPKCVWQDWQQVMQLEKNYPCL